MTTSPFTEGAHHIGLTVPNLNDTLAFFTDTLAFDKIAEKPDYPAAFVSDGTTMITLWQVNDPATATQFDRKDVIGLHHFALKVADADVLDDVHAKLQTSDGVEIEFAPEPIGNGPTKHMMITIPGGIRMEFIAPAG